MSSSCDISAHLVRALAAHTTKGDGLSGHPMPPAEFVAALATLGLSVRQYADMTRESPNNMRNWATIRLAIPDPHAEWLRRNVAIRLADPPPRRTR